MPAGRRILPQSMSTDPRYSRISLKAKVLYPLLWVNADDQGRLSGDPDKIKLAVCPSVSEIASGDIPDLIDEMDREGLIKYYKTKNSPAIQIRDWWLVERPQWAWPSDYDPPPGWTDHLRYKRGRDVQVKVNWPPDSGECSPENGGAGPTGQAPPDSPENSPERRGAEQALAQGEATRDSPEFSPENSGSLAHPKRKLKTNANSKQTEKETTSLSPQPEAAANRTKTRLKPHQQEAGAFLDLIEKHEGIPLLSRDKLINLSRKLFRIPGTTPERLRECYCWLKENDSFLASRAPPQVIGAMLDRYPAWAAGKLKPERGRDGNSRDSARKATPRRAKVRSAEEFESGEW